MDTASCVWRTGSATAARGEAAAAGASGPAGSRPQAGLRWGAGRAERRGSCSLTPPRCHGPPLRRPASGLERV